MKKILIVGAGGFGRELLQWIKDINAEKPTWEIGGFLDDNLQALDGVEIDYPVVGTISDWQPKDDEVFALAMGKPQLKRMVVEKLKSRGAHFAAVIHPTALVSPFAHYGEGQIGRASCRERV